jgi:hypothetical protein
LRTVSPPDPAQLDIAPYGIFNDSDEVLDGSTSGVATAPIVAMAGR